MERVLILGGSGRIGRSVATDLVRQTPVEITIAGREPQTGNQVAQALGSQVQFLALDLADQAGLQRAIAASSLVVHCAGPFVHRDARVLQTCIQEGVNYVDVSDNRAFTLKALAQKAAAEAAGITAVVNTGIFPGISNSMVRRDVEQLDQAERIHLSYVVAGSGGAGVTVMRTTFLGLQEPFTARLNGDWQTVAPYSDLEVVEFPQPYGQAPVYWFDVPETLTLPQSFPVQSVITKFGSVPNYYNYVTWGLAHWLPKRWLKNPAVIEFLAWGSHTTTQLTDRFSGIGVAIRSAVTGVKEGQSTQVISTLYQKDTAIAAGYGTGSIAQLLLSGELHKPGVWPVEQVLSTPQFEQTLAQRGVKLEQSGEQVHV